MIRLSILHGAAVAGLLVAAMTGAAQAGTLYAGPAASPSFAVIAPRLLSALFPEQRLTASAVDNGKQAVERVLDDPASAAVADLATMLDVIATQRLAADRLEFHGPIGAHCLLAFARRDGWVRAFSDVVAVEGTPQPVIGLAGWDATELFDSLRRIEPGLSSVTTQPGPARALATQVAHGAPDLLLLDAEPDLDRALVEHLADDDRLIMLPVVTRLLERATHDRNSGFTMQPVHSDSGLTPWSRRAVVTPCTPVGVVLRSDVPPALRDAVNRAVPVVAAAVRPSLTDQANAVAKKALHDTVDTMQQWLNQLRSN
jgi:hypothetical protein